MIFRMSRSEARTYRPACLADTRPALAMALVAALLLAGCGNKAPAPPPQASAPAPAPAGRIDLVRLQGIGKEPDVWLTTGRERQDALLAPGPDQSPNGGPTRFRLGAEDGYESGYGSDTDRRRRCDVHLRCRRSRLCAGCRNRPPSGSSSRH